MLENLKNALARKMISDQAVCDLLKISRKTLYNKLSGATEFTVGEAMAISANLLPEYSIRYLFTKAA